MKYKKLTIILFVIVSLLGVYGFFPNLVTAPNTTYFAADHDGMQNYFGHWYYIKYDSSYVHTQAMNYPHGEFIYYTGIQLVPSAIFKFINNNIIEISDYWIGIQNSMMLLSIVLCALFLFLVFLELKMNYIFSAIWALAITFLSPQLDRFGGHFSLAYLFVVPLALYLLLLFEKTKKYKYSIVLMFFAFWAYTTHPYFFGLIAILLLFYWIYVFIYNKEFSYKTKLYHVLLQFLLPLFAAQLIEIIFCSIDDRTSNPWGFFVYRAFPEGIFLPFGTSYGAFLHSLFKTTSYIQWEGIAYIGLAASIFTIATLLIILKRLIKRNFINAVQVTDNKMLNIFFWASFAALLYSFGLPFILGLEWLVEYIGPIRQMRGIGRFAWLFFFVINIVLAYKLWNWQPKKKILKYLILVPTLMIVYDAYSYSRKKEAHLNNKIELLSDHNNKLDANNWVNTINASQYQAIIALPYFHIGSENIWINAECSVLKHAFYTSLKTGLPMLNVYYSRTSLSQTYENISLSKEPYRPLNIVNHFPNRKPFLLLAINCDKITAPEQNLINQANFIMKLPDFSLYSLPFEVLEHIADSLYEKKINEYAKLSPDDITAMNAQVVHQSFDSIINSYAYKGKGCFSGKTENYHLLWEGQIPYFDNNQQYILSFWFGNILRDEQLRSTLIIAYLNENQNTIKEDWLSVQANVKILDNNWALIEAPLNSSLVQPNGKVRVLVINSEKSRGELLIDELLIRPATLDFYLKSDSTIMKNNRWFITPKL